MLNRTHVFAALAAACVLAGCGGGGGGSAALPSVASGGGGTVISGLPTPTPVPSGVPTGAPSSTPSVLPSSTPSPTPTKAPTPTPVPSASPTAPPAGYFAQGNVTDFDSGAPLGGATVVIAPPVYAGSTPPPGVATSAITAADGSFTIAALVPGSNYIEVFKNGFATLHEKLNVTSFNNQLGQIHVTILSADQMDWLAQINSDRAVWNAPPVVLDELLVEGARHWAAYMAAAGWYASSCPSSDAACQTAVQYETVRGGTYTSTGSNIDTEPAPSTWRIAQRRMMDESSACPQPVSPVTCPSTTAPRFLNLVNASFIWAGVAEVFNGKGTTLMNPFMDYYDQEFATPIHQ